MKFTKDDIGKMVKVNEDSNTIYHFTEGRICTVQINEMGDWLGVDVGMEKGIHDCDGGCESGTGVWVYMEDFDLF